MRLKYARLKGYIGIYNGMDGLTELEIDFSKAKNKITIIAGKNGSGKSTLEKALATPLPDNSSCFVPNMNGEKELHIIDDNNVYELLMVSPVTSNGNRGQSKAFIKKNGNELNSTGNITSYKEIVFTEFDLDPNFITLSRISGDDRGIADKSPSERKKFVSSIIESLEVYNDMNKTLSKKSNIFKSYINNLDIKIKNIGDEQALLSTSKDIDNRFKTLNLTRDRLNKEKSEAESFIKIVDPNGTLQDKYQIIYDKMKIINDDIDIKQKELDSLMAKMNIKEDLIESEYEKNKVLITETENKISASLLKLENLVSSREDLIKEMNILSQRIENTENDFDIDSLMSSLDLLRKTVSEQERIFTDAQITNFNISRDDFLLIFTTLIDIKNLVDVFKANKDKKLISASVTLIRNNRTNVSEEIENRKTLNDTLESELRDISFEIEKLNIDLDTMKILESRPNNCKIDSCPLISNAIKIKKSNPEKKLLELEKNKSNLEKELAKGINELSYLNEIKGVVDELLKIIDQISIYKVIISKVPTSIIFTDIEEFLTRIDNGNNFNEISDMRKYIDLADRIDNYQSNKENVIKLESELEINKNKIKVIEDLKKDYSKMQQKFDSIKESIEKETKEKKFNEDLLSSFQNTGRILVSIRSYKMDIDSLKEEKSKLKEEYLTIKDNIVKIKNYVDKINIINTNLLQVENDLAPLQDQKDAIQFSLNTLQSYKQELEMYQEKYNIVNILKKYSSPTAGGIQTLYMNIYMSKTLSMANEILSMLFSGEYRLLPYVINASEFRIPFMGNGLEVDDISSGSTSQVCMMGMVMNLVLLYQASTKFNIVFLDEQDGGLDSHNRYQFIDVLYKMIDILNIDQLIMISHSIEMEMSNVDIIKLKGYDEDEIFNGNIIYEYKGGL